MGQLATWSCFTVTPLCFLNFSDLFSWGIALAALSPLYVVQLGETVSNWAGDNFLTQNTDSEVRINELQKLVWSRQRSFE